VDEVIGTHRHRSYPIADSASTADWYRARLEGGKQLAFDFSRLASSGAITDITNPATLFDALPNKSGGYGY
jgi:hypothetical protein